MEVSQDIKSEQNGRQTGRQAGREVREAGDYLLIIPSLTLKVTMADLEF